MVLIRESAVGVLFHDKAFSNNIFDDTVKMDPKINVNYNCNLNN